MNFVNVTSVDFDRQPMYVNMDTVQFFRPNIVSKNIIGTKLYFGKGVLDIHETPEELLALIDKARKGE